MLSPCKGYHQFCQPLFVDVEPHRHYSETGVLDSLLQLAQLLALKQELSVEGVDLSGAKYHVIDQERLLSWSPAVSEIKPNEVLLIEW